MTVYKRTYPWVAYPSRHGGWKVDSSPEWAAYRDPLTVELTEEDARLIAAAPDLYAALELLRNPDLGSQLSAEALDYADETLAKAQGVVDA